MQKKNVKKEIWTTIVVLLMAAFSAFTLHVFVYPADFAPSGVDGIATMLQKLTGVSAGIFTAAMNLPILIAALFVLNKRYVIYTIVYIAVSSALLVFLRNIEFYSFATEKDLLLPAIFSGIFLGLRSGVLLRVGASGAGVEVVSSMIQKNRPYLNVERITAIFCYAVIVLSYFVYWDLNSVLLAIVQTFVYEKAAAFVLKGTRNAVEFKIITKDPERIKQDIITKLKHGATIVKAHGAFSNEESNVVMTVVNKRQVPEFLNFVKSSYPGVFVYYSEVTGVHGNFRFYKDDEVK